ncbi:hypothetical protein ACLX1H_004277 [Fusarium chlamydosporum]
MSTNGTRVTRAAEVTIYVTISKPMVGNQFQWSISIYNRPEDTYSTFGAILTAEDGQWDVTAHRRPWREEPGFFDEAMMGESYTENVRWIGDLSAEVPAPSGNLDGVQN